MISIICLIVISLFLLPAQNLHVILGQPAQTANSSSDSGLINTTNRTTSIANAVKNATNNITKNLNASIANAVKNATNNITKNLNASIANAAASKVNAATAVNPTAAVKVIVDSNLPYIFIFLVFFMLIIPLVLDLWLAYRRKSANTDKANARIAGIPGLYRALMTFGVILLVGTVIFYILALITFSINVPSPVLQSLIDLLKNLGTILGTALATIIAFYFGMRGAESAAEKAVAATKPSGTTGTTGTTGNPSIVSISPNDGASTVAVDSDIRVGFSEPVDKTTVNVNSFSLKDSNNNPPKTGTVSLSTDGKTATFKPDTSLSANTTYHVTVSGVKVLSDLRPIPIKTWSFTTK